MSVYIFSWMIFSLKFSLYLKIMNINDVLFPLFLGTLKKLSANWNINA